MLGGLDKKKEIQGFKEKIAGKDKKIQTQIAKDKSKKQVFSNSFFDRNLSFLFIQWPFNLIFCFLTVFFESYF